MTNTTKPIKRKNVQENGEKSAEQPEIKPLKYGPMPTFSHQRVWSRLVLILGVVVYIWYTSKNEKQIVLASQKDMYEQRGQSFACDESYMEEINDFPGCVPSKCGRHVSDKLVSKSEAETLLKLAKRGIALGGSDGGASILDLHSGALSYGKKFVNVYSLENAKKVFNAADLAIYKIVKTKIQNSIAKTFGLDAEILYLTHPTFFSKLTNGDPKTPHDEYWHAHVDKDTYESFHYTSLLYLSDYGIDFEGGRLIWLDSVEGKPTTNVTLEPRKGRVAMFSSGAENVHFVERVATGVRYAITVSFTCDVNKSIKDPTVH